MRPFRFGVSVWSASTREEWQAKARAVEDLGYATFLVADHLSDMYPPLTPLVSAADATTHLRVGSLVVNNDLRHPVVLAREAAVVDLLTDGRLELGLGAGHMRSEYEEAGITFDPGATRVERLEESVAIVGGLLAGDTVSFTGRHYRVEGHRVHPLPVQRPRPPLLVGGNGRRLLGLAARVADIVGLVGFSHREGGAAFDFSHFTSAGTAVHVERIRDEAGPRADTIELNALVQRVVVTDDRRAAAEELGEHLPGLSPDEILDSPYLLLGTAEEMVEQLRRRREALGISYYVVFEPAMEALAPVVARLAGT